MFLSTVASFEGGKMVSPSNEGVTGPDPKYLPGSMVFEVEGTSNLDGKVPGFVVAAEGDKVSEKHSKGRFIPGEAWSDGFGRIIWNKDSVPAFLLPNTTIMEAPAKETDDEFDKRFIDYFNREDIDGWELRKALQELHVSYNHY